MERTIYKLTDANDRTCNATQWAAGVTHVAPGNGLLCTKAYVHAYTHPLVAVFMDPVHGKFGPDAHLWVGTAEVERDDGTKLGCTSLTTLERMELPVLSTAVRVRVGILRAREVYREEKWVEWANSWLSGADRSRTAAAAAGARAGVRAVAAWTAVEGAEARAGARAAAAAEAAWGAAAWEMEAAPWAARAVEARATQAGEELVTTIRRAIEDEAQHG